MHVVVIYGPDIPYGRECVGAFDTRDAAEEHAGRFVGRDLKIFSWRPPAYTPNTQDLGRVAARAHLHDIEKRARRGDLCLVTEQTGATLYLANKAIGHWPANRGGTGTYGRVMPLDLWQWALACVFGDIPPILVWKLGASN